MNIQHVIDLLNRAELYEESSVVLEIVQQNKDMLEALKIADKFCGSLTSDECPDSVHIPIREAITKAEASE